ncbi:RNA polymerase sigma factor [Nonomuraea muscovyensis]|uniref:RNA polymerase sigma-70 factor (ECF subfamily) n=1 Tax=Nonomuraea muscovyensis TaxID=1124761 RepID=A0A7X0EY30_9ACTN|nr:RNA polymerase sigma factor [Nonomuraea muscovyensis]MBB6345276.1 RNA polymerase sigma-70 factor (ECF subfamily) [Nonomuraea muscovyensis]
MTQRDRFEAVYDAYYPAIHQYAARRTGSPDDTADVISETFLTAWRRIGEVPEGERALLWLYGVARRVLANQKRGASRRAVLAERLRDELVADRPATPVDLAYVRTAFDGLPERDREVLALACWEGLTSEQIAKVVGCTAIAARARLHRARKRLAATLERQASSMIVMGEA